MASALLYSGRMVLLDLSKQEQSMQLEQLSSSLAPMESSGAERKPKLEPFWCTLSVTA
jgi:hypothetical protein